MASIFQLEIYVTYSLWSFTSILGENFQYVSLVSWMLHKFKRAEKNFQQKQNNA